MKAKITENIKKMLVEFERYDLFKPESVLSVREKESNTICWSGEPVVFIKDLFLQMPQFDVIAYVHPFYCNLLSKENEGLPAILDDMAQLVGPKAKVVSLKNERAVKRALRRNGACLLREGGILVGGREVEKVFATCLVLEKSALAYVEGIKLDGAKTIGYFHSLKLNHEYKTSYSKIQEEKTANEALAHTEKKETEVEVEETEKVEIEKPKKKITEKEMTMRRRVVTAGKDLVKKNLVQATWGNISLRLDDKYMLVTPSGYDYMKMKPEDIVKVDIETLSWEGDIKPTSEKKIHGAIYKAHPECKAIIHTHPMESCVFAAAEREIPIMNNDMRIKIGGVAKLVPYAPAGSHKLTKETVKALENVKACILSHHGIFCRGENMKEAFEICSLMEAGARERLEAKY